MPKPWLANFVASIRGCDGRKRGADKRAELYGLAVLGRNLLRLCDEERIAGDDFNERLCRTVLYRLRRFADFSLLEDRSGDLKMLRDAQRRLEGMVGPVRFTPLPLPG